MTVHHLPPAGDIRAERGKRQRHASASAIRQYIEGRVLDGSLQPGQYIDEAALASQFNVSRTPVREALLQLAAIDWVQFRGSRRTVVTPIPLRKIIQMFDVEAELEALCAKLAADHMSSAERLLLASATQRCAVLADTPGVDPGDYFEANQAFHEILYRGSHNEYLCETTMALNHRLVPYRRFRLLSHARMKVSSREHSAIAKVVIEGLAAKAALKMRNHMTIQAALLSELAAQLPTSYLDTA